MNGSVPESPRRLFSGRCNEAGISNKQVSKLLLLRHISRMPERSAFGGQNRDLQYRNSHLSRIETHGVNVHRFALMQVWRPSTARGSVDEYCTPLCSDHLLFLANDISATPLCSLLDFLLTPSNPYTRQDKSGKSSQETNMQSFQ